MPAETTLISSFEQLHEGDSFATGSRTVTEADVAAFGALLGDLGDHDHGGWAGPTEPRRPVVPGALTLALTLALARTGPGGAIAMRGMSDVVFTRPVRVGDSVSVTGRIAALAPSGGLVTVVLLTANQHGKTVCRARVQMLWRRDPAADPPTEENA